jgi:bifunctional non-homologous end joining protein LigD
VRLRVGAYVIELSHPDKVLFPGARPLTKRDLAEYYRRIAPTMLPHLTGRPIVMQRFPNGIEDAGFFHKDIPDYFPEWVDRVTLPKKGGSVTHVVCNHAATLVYLASQACITPHVWLSRADRPRHPDRLIFDLDPPADDFAPVRRAARLVGTLLSDLGLTTYLMTTGSRGVYVVVPLDRRADFDVVRAFARAAAALLVGRHPRELTMEPRVADRGGRLYLDTARNAYAQSAAPPYAVRARPRAPVATPITWRELDRPSLDAQSYRADNLFRRLARIGDPWRDLARRGQSLTRARAALMKLVRNRE